MCEHTRGRQGRSACACPVVEHNWNVAACGHRSDNTTKAVTGVPVRRAQMRAQLRKV